MDALATLIGASTLATAASLAAKYALPQDRLEDILNQNPNERPLQMGHTYYVVPPNNTTVRSRKRDYQRLIMQYHGVTSGRQWVRVRKSLPKYLRSFV